MKTWTLVVSAGQGPAEVRAFVALLAEVLAERARAAGLEVGAARAEGPCPASVRLALEGEAEAALGGLLGTHLLIDPSRGAGARRRWFAGVSLHPDPEAAPALRPEHVRLQATRAGGPGGQHLNKTASAVRAVHVPTGLAVRASGQRRQGQNRRDALRRLDEALQGEADRARERAEAQRWRGLRGFARGQPVATWRRDARGRLTPA